MMRWMKMAWILPFLLGFSACSSDEGSDEADWLKGEPDLLYPKTKTGALYTESTVVEFDIGFSDEVWEAFVAAWKPVKDSDTWFHCSFAFAGERFLDAACRHKGNSSDPQSETKPQFIVRFDKWDDTGRFFGVRRIDLEVFPEFAAPVRGRVAMRMMREAGLPAPRVNNARVTVNGTLMGLYQNIEVIDHEFLEQRFDTPIGNLYHQDGNGWHLDTNSSTGNIGLMSNLETLVDAWSALNGGDATSYEEQLATSLNINTVLQETAAEMVLPVCDNFSNGGWNYYFYQMADGQLILLPWDLDQVLSDRAPPEADVWVFLGNRANSNETPGIGLDLRTFLFSNAGWKSTYEDFVVAFRDGPFASAKDRIARICAQIRPVFEEDPNAYGTLDDFDQDCANLQERITQRITYLQGVLGR